MTKISQYGLDNNIGGNDRWIGSDAQNFLMTKNFTPNNVATYFNNNNVIDIGTSVRYRYQTLDVGEAREQGTISFETEIGPQVNFSSITTFLLAKNTLKQNDVTQYLSFIVGTYVLISKASNINTFGFYKISSIEPYIPDPNFFVVVVEFQSGNGFIHEDLDYLISLVDKNTGGNQTLQQTLINGNTATDIGIQFINTGGGSSIIYYNRIVNNGIYYWPSGDSSIIATEKYVEDNAYPLNSNPAGYLTQEEVEEYPDLASFPVTGTVGVIYIALDTELFYIWNGSAYVISSPPDTGITGGGIVNRVPKFTPNGTTIGDSNFSDNGTVGGYSIGGSYVEFITGSNIYLRLNRATTNRMDFILGNPGLGQTAQITSSNVTGLELISNAGYVSLKSGSNEGLRVLSSGKLQFTQNPDAGASTDDVLVRDSSGNIKIIPYPSVSEYVPYTGADQNVDLGVYGLTSEYLQLNTSPTTYTPAVGRIGWNDTDGTLEFKLKGNNVTLQIGQEQVIRVVNKTTPLINLLESNYQVCVVSGATGQRVSVRLAQANNDANSAGTLGVVTENIDSNQEGFITTSGQVREINTTGSLQGETWSDGDILYLSPTTAGAITNIKPQAPNHTVIVGYVEYAHAIHGKIYVKIDNGYELDELHNVKITSPQNEDVLMYNSASSIWKNKDPFDYFAVIPAHYNRHINTPTFGSTTHNNVEGITLVISGALTSRTWADTNLVTRTQRAGIVSSTTNTIGQQIRQLQYGFSRNSGFTLFSGFNMAENANDTGIRFLLCIRNDVGTYSNVEPNTLINLLGFCRLSTSNNIHIIHNDATGIATTIDLGSNFPANTVSQDKYLFKIQAVPTGVYFRIDRIGTSHYYETIVTTDIPNADLGFSFGGYIVDTSGPNTTTGVDWYGTYVKV